MSQQLIQLLSQAESKLSYLRQQQKEQVGEQKKKREYMEQKKDEGVNREKILKREIDEMRKELEDAFGLSKIIQLENRNHDLERQREQLEDEIKVLMQVQQNQHKALEFNDNKQKKGMKHVTKLQDEFRKLNLERKQLDQQTQQEREESEKIERDQEKVKEKTIKLMKVIQIVKDQPDFLEKEEPINPEIDALEQVIQISNEKIVWSEMRRLKYDKESEIIEEDVKKLKIEIKRLEQAYKDQEVRAKEILRTMQTNSQIKKAQDKQLPAAVQKHILRSQDYVTKQPKPDHSRRVNFKTEGVDEEQE